MTWITQSLSMGGQLVVEQTLPATSPPTYLARMRWHSTQATVIGHSELEFDKALSSLDYALMEDCAQEMIDKGVV